MQKIMDRGLQAHSSLAQKERNKIRFYGLDISHFFSTISLLF